jgi:hypothetical protein
MSDEFKRLQRLINSKQVELKLKKSLNDTFGIWLYWISETKKPKFIWKIFFRMYWLFSSEWFWIPLSIFLAIKMNLFYLFGFLVPFLVTKIFKPIGQGFIIYDAQKNEELFDDLWDNQQIGIMSTKMSGSVLDQKEFPEIIIDSFNQNWREEIIKNFNS